MTTHTVRRISIVDDTNSGKALDVRIAELCDLMATAGWTLVSTLAVGGQILFIYAKN